MKAVLIEGLDELYAHKSHLFNLPTEFLERPCTMLLFYERSVSITISVIPYKAHFNLRIIVNTFLKLCVQVLVIMREKCPE